MSQPAVETLFVDQDTAAEVSDGAATPQKEYESSLPSSPNFPDGSENGIASDEQIEASSEAAEEPKPVQQLNTPNTSPPKPRVTVPPPGAADGGPPIPLVKKVPQRRYFLTHSCHIA